MMQRLALALLLLLAPFAGCLDDASDGGEPMPPASGRAGPLYEGAGLLFAGEPLYRDPQNAPHPSFNFPTLSHPAAGPNVPEFWAPVPAAELPSTLADLEFVTNAGARTSAGMAAFGSIAVLPSAHSVVVDISDPTAPTLLSSFRPQEETGSHRGAAFIPYPDGRLVVVLSTGGGIDVWDLTDPREPQPLPPLVPDVGSHKVGIIPGTPIVVNAASDGGAPTNPATSPGRSEMWDLSDPENPVRLPDFENGYSCHHVYFWNDAEQQKFRGVCAGIQYTQIWDTTDPYHPSVIVSVPFGSGGTPAEGTGYQRFANSFSHYAGLSQDGTILLVGDESGGGAGPAGCVARVDVPGVGAVSVPIGAVWFYDVSDETSPELLGWVSASQFEKFQPPAGPGVPNTGGSQASCTAHHGRLIPFQDRDLLAMAFYGAGVVVVDFTSLRGEAGAMPEVVAQWSNGSNTWEVWHYNGWILTGDLNRGMDVLKLV